MTFPGAVKRACIFCSGIGPERVLHVLDLDVDDGRSTRPQDLDDVIHPGNDARVGERLVVRTGDADTQPAQVCRR